GQLIELAADSCQDLGAQILMHHLAAAETPGDLHLVAFLEKSLHRAHLPLVVMVVDAWPHLHFLDLDYLLLAARVVRFLLLLVLELAEIADLAQRRIGIRRDLDQIELRFLGHVERLAQPDDADHVAGLADQANAGSTDLPVHARTLAGRRGLLHWSYDGWSLLCVCPGGDAGDGYARLSCDGARLAGCKA